MSSEASLIIQNKKSIYQNTYDSKDLFMFSKLPRLHFVTINPNKGLDSKLRINKIGKWSDYLKRFSKNYFIVRESEKNYHFHALVSLDKDLKFVKHVHFDVRPVSDKPKIPDTRHQFVCEAERLGGLVDGGVLTSGEADVLLEAFEKKQTQEQREKQRQMKSFLRDKKDNKLFNIFRYMLKENPSILFEDYILYIDGVMLKADQLNEASEGDKDITAPTSLP